jgi:glycerol-3-phosphate dehydrogenase
MKSTTEEGVSKGGDLFGMEADVVVNSGGLWADRIGRSPLLHLFTPSYSHLFISKDASRTLGN